MEKIIDPIPLELLKAELTPEKKLRNTNKGGNEIYDITYANSPNLMKELGRLREVTFRASGCGTGNSVDIDEYDVLPEYHQLIVWDPEAEAIIGSYRYMIGSEARFKEDGQPYIICSHLYEFSDEFIEHYLPHTMELSRAFVTLDYQSSKAGAKAIYALDNLWDGIAAVMLSHTRLLFLMGKMTIVQSYDDACRELILRFLRKHFPDKDGLAHPYKPVKETLDPRIGDLILNEEDTRKDFRNLKAAVRSLGENIPPMINTYLNTSPTMRMLGCAINDEFLDSYDIGIIIYFDNIYADKFDRHVKTYFSDRMIRFRERFPRLAENIEDRFMSRRFEHRKKVFGKFNQKKEKK